MVECGRSWPQSGQDDLAIIRVFVQCVEMQATGPKRKPASSVDQAQLLPLGSSLLGAGCAGKDPFSSSLLYCLLS
jgi:hypothetical protein